MIKPLKIALSATKNRSAWATPNIKNNIFFVKIPVADHQLSKTFYFVKI